MNTSPFSQLFYLEHRSGDKLYPVRIKNRDTGVVAFRLSKRGNTKKDSIEVTDESVMKSKVLNEGYAVRASTLNRSRFGLYRFGAREIRRVVELA